MAGEGAQAATLPALPAIASIDTATADKAFDSDINSILATVPSAPPVTAVPYTTGHDSVPKVPNPNLKAPVDGKNQPLTRSVADQHVARVKNSINSFRNTLREFTNKKETEKNDNLKADITTALKAQQNIDAARQILQNKDLDPQSKTNAQNVLDSNMELLERKLKGKTGKDIQKAFDVSLTDASQNNTPQIKAAQGAEKEVKAATAAGIAPNTPEEKKVQDMAANGGKPPAAVDASKSAAAATAPPKSSTPYADQFLRSQPASIGINPEYAAQVAQKQAYDKANTQYVLPKIIDAYQKRAIQKLKDNREDAREQFKGVKEYQLETAKMQTAVNIANAADATRVKMNAATNATMLAETQMRVSAVNGALGDARLSKYHQDLVDGQIKFFDTSIQSANAANASLAAQMASNMNTDGTVKDDQKNTAWKAQMDMNNLFIQQQTDNRQKFIAKQAGAPSANENTGVVTGTTKGYLNGGSGQSTTNNPNNSGKPTVDAGAGADASDSPEDEEHNEINKQLNPQLYDDLINN